MLVAVFYLSLIIIINGSHFRGGLITWQQAPNAISNNSNITLIIEQHYSWSRAVVSCTNAQILNRSLIGDTTVNPIVCLSTSSQCNSSGYTEQQLSSEVYCTDINPQLGISAGRRSQLLSLSNGTKLVLAFQSVSTWLSLAYGTPAGTGWSMVMLIDLTPRPNVGINHSPTSTMSDMITVPVKISTIIEIPMSDSDQNDTLKCRWASPTSVLNGLSVDECAGACNTLTLPTTVQLLTSTINNCQLNVTLPYVGYYAVALQIEDFAANQSRIALSSVPLQFLLYAFDNSNPVTFCTIPPKIIDVQPNSPSNGGKVSVQVDVLYTGVVVAQTGCENDTDMFIANFITTSPPGMIKTNLPFAWTTVPLYAINLTWTPTMDQLDSTFTFCAVAIDGNGYSSESFCFNFLVVSQATTSPSQPIITVLTSSSSSDGRLLALGLGLGLPLLFVLSSIVLYACYRSNFKPTNSNHKLPCRNSIECTYCRRIDSFDWQNQTFENTLSDYRQEYITDENIGQNEPAVTVQQRLSPGGSLASGSLSVFDLNELNTTRTSFFSPSSNSLPTDRVEGSFDFQQPSNSAPRRSIVVSKQLNQKPV